MTVNQGPMWLVYVSEDGENHYQPWTDLVEAGTLTDPETGEDMQMVGWTINNPAWEIPQRKSVRPTT
jgi:hypothetical protein